MFNDDEEKVRKRVLLDLEVNAEPKEIEKNPFSWIIYLAEAIDAWRIFPRIFISLYMYMVWRVVEWFIALPDPTMEQSGLISIVVGAGAAWFGLYVNTNGDGKSYKMRREDSYEKRG